MSSQYVYLEYSYKGLFVCVVHCSTYRNRHSDSNTTTKSSMTVDDNVNKTSSIDKESIPESAVVDSSK